MKNSENDIDKILKKLFKFKNSPSPILSIYLGSASKQTPSSTLMSTQFHSLIHQNLTGKEQKIFRSDIDKIDTHLRESYDSRGKRSIAFFSGGKNLWETLDFEFYLSPLCLVSYSPYTRPITEALDKYKKYLVLLADREKARIFTVHLGKIEEHEDVFGIDVPQRVKRGDDTWDQQNKILRHIEDHLHRHLKLIAEKTNQFAKNNPVNFVLIGGHPEMIPKIKKHLPYPLNKMVLGKFVTELNIPLNEIFLNSKKVVAEIFKDVQEEVK